MNQVESKIKIFCSPFQPLALAPVFTTRKLRPLSETYVHIHADLIEACKRGERKAQYKLYQLYSRAMFNICTRMLGDQQLAEDALQEAFVSAFRKLHTFEGKASFGAWLKRIVINKCLSMLDKKKIFTEPVEKAEEKIVQEPGPVAPSLKPELIHQAIKELPKGCRVVFTLYQLEGYDHQEISQIMDISVSTSKSQYHRAKKLLQEKLTLQGLHV